MYHCLCKYICNNRNIIWKDLSSNENAKYITFMSWNARFQTIIISYIGDHFDSDSQVSYM